MSVQTRKCLVCLPDPGSSGLRSLCALTPHSLTLAPIVHVALFFCWVQMKHKIHLNTMIWSVTPSQLHIRWSLFNILVQELLSPSSFSSPASDIPLKAQEHLEVPWSLIWLQCNLSGIEGSEALLAGPPSCYLPKRQRTWHGEHSASASRLPTQGFWAVPATEIANLG